MLVASDPPCLLDHPSLRAYREREAKADDTVAKSQELGFLESENFPAPEGFEDEPDPVEQEFQRQLAELRKANAAVYANPTPWKTGR